MVILQKMLSFSIEQRNRSRIYYELGLVHHLKKEWDQALEHFSQVLESEPERIDVQLRCARIYYRKKDWEDCSDSAFKVMELNHNVPYVHLLIGAVLLKLDEDSLALSYLEHAIAMNPNLALAHRLLSQYWLDKNDHGRHSFHRIKYQQIMRQNKERRMSSFSDEHHRDTTKTNKQPLSSFAPSPFVFEALENQKNRAESVIVATGLPRSGTSMLMQMLKAGGIPVHSDQNRQADEHNLKGYFEHDLVKSLLADNQWVSSVTGNAIKVVAPLLEYLPTSLHYRVIFIERPFAEIARSQHLMKEELRDDDSCSEALEKTINIYNTSTINPYIG